MSILSGLLLKVSKTCNVQRLFLFLGVSVTIVIVVFVAVAIKQSGSRLPAEIIMMTAIVPGCGNAIREVGEECDGTDLAGESCTSKGFSSGVLSCTLSCTFNTTACTQTVSSSGSTGGVQSTGAQVILAGSAYPNSRVTVLKDAQVIASTVADDRAHFQVIASNLSAGRYMFSLYSEDVKGNRSSVRNFPLTLTKNILNKIDSIFLSPTLSGDKVQVRRGDPVVFFGQSSPIADVTIEVNSSDPHFVKTAAGKDGVYLYNFDTSVLELGQHHAKARSTAEQIISPQSSAYGFTVGTTNVFAPASTTCGTKGDLNNDCHVNLVDFSIAAFWYEKVLSPAFSSREKAHLNGDGKVTIIDFSIMAFHWTG